MPFVTLQRVVKRFGATTVVHGIDLEVERGEFVVLVGPSGCGKSTTLRMVAGLEEITEGTISIEGRVINRVSPKDRDVAMVFQNYALYPHLDVFNNIAFGLKLRSVPKARIRQLVDEAARVLGLEKYMGRKPADLSGGQRQRVAMGRAIVRDPKVFLFDEPLSNLDTKLRTQMRAELRRLHDRLQATSLYVTHDQIEAMTLADRIVVMNEGCIEQVGPPLSLFRDPANTFVAGFLGSPAMNLLPGSVVAFDGQLRLRLNDEVFLPVAPRLAASLSAGRSVVVGLRPESLRLEPNPDAECQRLPVAVELVEPLGSEALLHLRLGNGEVIAKTDVGGDPAALKKVESVFVQTDDVYLFDGETQRALSREQT